MGVKRRLPAWTLMAGLACVFVGARVFEGKPAMQGALLVVGGGLIAGVTLWRAWAWRRAEGDDRRIERVFALSYLGCLVAAVGFIPGTEQGLEWLGLDFQGLREEARFRRLFLVLSTVLLTISILPALAAEWAAGKGGAGGSRPVDAIRILETASSALSVALAGVLLMLAGYIGAARNATVDFSYFKTSGPGEAVQEIVLSMETPLRVVSFFPDASPVADEVSTYFQALGRLTDNVVVESYDRFASPEVAREYEVRSDGDVVLEAEGRRERLGIPTELNAARGRLRLLDGDVQKTLLMLSRDRRYAYLTAGHGELNDPVTIGAAAQQGPGADPLSAFRQLLELLNYEVREIGLQRGLGDRIPDDAAMVMALGPTRPFFEPEVRAIQEYLEGGGSLLLALEPDSEFRVGALGDLLGVEYGSAMTVDDERHLRQSGGLTDRRLIVTNRFSSHPSVTTASRQGVATGVLLIGPGVIRTLDEPGRTRASQIVRSLPSSFADLNGNFRFDEEAESRESYVLATAIEGVPAEGGGELRALVYGDSEMFTDAVLTSLALNAALAADGIRWLGREERFAGEVTSEVDVPIVHTRSEDVAWFYSIIFGAPLLVLAMGVATLYRRRPNRGEES